MNQTPEITKISISIYPPLLERFRSGIGQFIKRDAFINHLIAHETAILRAELCGQRNSEAAKRHIARELRNLKPHTINIVVEKIVAARLNQVVDELNLVRDAFLNFLFYCLDPAQEFFSGLDLPLWYTSSHYETEVQPPSLSAFQRLDHAISDPLYYLRKGVTDKFGFGLYSLELPFKLHGFSCHLRDESVPSTRAFKRADQDAESMMQMLKELEAGAFAGPQEDTK